MGGISIKGFKDILPLTLGILTNPLIMLGMVLLASTFFLWLYILSWFKLGLVFPMTALVFVFVALLSYFFLGERLHILNYFGVILIASGVFFILHK